MEKFIYERMKHSIKKYNNDIFMITAYMAKKLDKEYNGRWNVTLSKDGTGTPHFNKADACQMFFKNHYICYIYQGMRYVILEMLPRGSL